MHHFVMQVQQIIAYIKMLQYRISLKAYSMELEINLITDKLHWRQNNQVTGKLLIWRLQISFFHTYNHTSVSRTSHCGACLCLWLCGGGWRISTLCGEDSGTQSFFFFFPSCWRQHTNNIKIHLSHCSVRTSQIYVVLHLGQCIPSEAESELSARLIINA